MKMSALSYNIYKNLLLAKCAKPTTRYIIKRFHLHYRELPLLQRNLLIITTTLLIKALENHELLQLPS